VELIRDYQEIVVAILTALVGVIAWSIRTASERHKNHEQRILRLEQNHASSEDLTRLTERIESSLNQIKEHFDRQILTIQMRIDETIKLIVDSDRGHRNR
jgi:hypothetical protein